jgi:hypothetical protein
MSADNDQAAAGLRAMTKDEIAAALGNGLRQMTRDEFVEWQEVKRRAHELGVTLPSDGPQLPPIGSMLGFPF